MHIHIILVEPSEVTSVGGKWYGNRDLTTGRINPGKGSDLSIYHAGCLRNQHHPETLIRIGERSLRGGCYERSEQRNIACDAMSIANNSGSSVVGLQLTDTDSSMLTTAGRYLIQSWLLKEAKNTRSA